MDPVPPGDSIRRMPDVNPLSPEQTAIISGARERALEWLDRKQFGSLNFTPEQKGMLERALVDVREPLESGQAIDRSITRGNHQFLKAEFRGKAGARAVISADNSGFEFRLRQTGGSTDAGTALARSLFGYSEYPYGDTIESRTLMQFWQFTDMGEPLENVDFWVTHLFPDNFQQSKFLDKLPKQFRDLGKGYDAYWTDESCIDLVVDFRPSKIGDVVVIRRIRQNDGSNVFIRRGNYNDTNIPSKQVQKEKEPVRQLIPEPVRVKIDI